MEKLISTKLKELTVTTKLLASCPITGIIIRLEVPACTAVLDYRNPLADIANIAALVEKEKNLESLPAEVLAGMLLALLKKRRLLAESKLSAAEQNLLLQTVPAKVLIAALQLVVRFTKEQASILVAHTFSLDSQIIVPDGKEFKLSLVISNILTIWKNIIFPEVLHIDSSLTASELKSVKLPKESSVLTLDNKATLKELLNKLIAEDVASDKVIKVLKIAFTGQNLLSLLAKGGIGEKLIAALDTYQTATASLLAEKLLSMQKNLTVKEKAEQLFSLDRVSDLAESKPKRTLAELLAYKKEQRLLDSRLAEGRTESLEEKNSLESENELANEGDNNDEL